MQTKVENYRIDILTNHTRNMFANISSRNNVSFKNFFVDFKKISPLCKPPKANAKFEPFFNNSMVDLDSFDCSKCANFNCNSDLDRQLKMFRSLLFNDIFPMDASDDMRVTNRYSQALFI